jgi:hypothetical protein
MIVARYAVGFSDAQMSMFRAVFLLNILRKCLLDCASKKSFVRRIYIHSHVALC